MRKRREGISDGEVYRFDVDIVLEGYTVIGELGGVEDRLGLWLVGSGRNPFLAGEGVSWTLRSANKRRKSVSV